MSKPQLELALLRLLRRPTEGPERFTLPPDAEPALRRALAADLDGPRPQAALTRTLKLICAMDSKLRSPTVAEALRALLRAEPEAVAIIRQSHLQLSGLDEARSFARREGRAARLRAPTVASPGAPKRLQVKDFLDPTGRSASGRAAAQAPAPRKATPEDPGREG